MNDFEITKKYLEEYGIKYSTNGKNRISITADNYNNNVKIYECNWFRTDFMTVSYMSHNNQCKFKEKLNACFYEPKSPSKIYLSGEDNIRKYVELLYSYLEPKCFKDNWNRSTPKHKNTNKKLENADVEKIKEELEMMGIFDIVIM